MVASMLRTRMSVADMGAGVGAVLVSSDGGVRRIVSLQLQEQMLASLDLNPRRRGREPHGGAPAGGPSPECERSLDAMRGGCDAATLTTPRVEVGERETEIVVTVELPAFSGFAPPRDGAYGRANWTQLTAIKPSCAPQARAGGTPGRDRPCRRRVARQARSCGEVAGVLVVPSSAPVPG
jgi:hypothetical protein